MNPSQLEARLNAAADGTWAEMVGTDWEFYARILHPAHDTLHGDRTVSWQSIADTRNIRTISDRSWFEVSGTRLHQGEKGEQWDAEPTVGASGNSIIPDLMTTLRKIEGSKAYLGEFDGAESSDEQRATEAPNILVSHRRYFISEMTLEQLDQTVQNEDRWGFSYVFWASSGDWCINADIDLPSTIIGCTSSVGNLLLANDRLEVVRISPDHPVRA
ncbi:hypothetical protein Kisp01_23430 [Kineosporia sp. NBRC 101677]|uniref:hypothetical protein n=1 Tax=Kineosporia sp. NBRC 101677 TaxID=3032197 RepID=UPI000B0C588C|nr:hypothetical protein [Kineosporia sp. NBRC 101677]GLY15328.1 hypothetical protein Kisp01_23430 [Kineosporia sp. NBRC 101677]